MDYIIEFDITKPGFRKIRVMCTRCDTTIYSEIFNVLEEKLSDYQIPDLCPKCETRLEKGRIL